MKHNPLVTVIVPCYNHQNFIEECLLSVLHQSYGNIQLIVIDDGSTDDSVRVVKQLQTQHDFLFIEQQNMGLSSTLNKAIKKFTKGEYIALLASDDFWHKDKLIKQLTYFELKPTVAMVFSQAAIVNEKSEIVDRFEEARLKEFCTFEDLILDKKGIPALTVVLKKEVFDRVGFFDENLLIEDWDMWLRIANEYKIGYVKAELAYYRMHGSNTSSKLEIMLQERFKIIKKWEASKPEIYKKALTYWQLSALKTFVINNKIVAKKFFHLSFGSYFMYKYYKLLYKYYFK